MRAAPVVPVLLSLLACGPGNTEPDGGEFPNPPETTLLSAPAPLAASASATFEFSSDVADATFLCAFDDEPQSVCASPLTREALAEGEHTFSVRATHSGQTDASPATHRWTVDLTAPNTSLTSTPPAFSASASAALAFESDDAGAQFECRVTPATEFAACTSPHQVTALADGAEVTFEVRAIDPVGNVDATPAAFSWRVDLTAPETTLQSVPPSRSAQPTATVGFSASEAVDRFECRLSPTTAFAPCDQPLQLQGLVDGTTYTLEVRAVDLAGNEDPTPAEHTWTVDLARPQTTITSGPPEFTSNTSAELSFTADETVDRYECRLSPATTFTACSSPYALSGLSEGTRTFEVRAVDLVEWEDATPAALSWTVDVTAPQTFIVAAPSSPHGSSSASVSFSSPDSTAVFECRLDAATFALCTSPHTITGLTDGQSVSFSVRAVDRAHNADPTPATASWTVDLPPETFITNSPPTEQTETSITFEFDSDDPAAEFECTFAGATDPCTSPVTYSGLAVGEHTFSVVAVDVLPQPDPTPATWTFRVVPPVTRIRIMAANLTSGNGQDYTPGHGIRIMQGVDADIIAVQEFDYLSSSAADLRTMVDLVCGTECHYFRENDGTDSLPNGVISRYPILQSGEWTQFNNVNGGVNRDYVWARIDIPGPVDLWVISVHLHSGSSTNRAAEANELVSNVAAVIPAGDYVALAGDFNTDSRSEAAVSNLSSAFVTAGPYPLDQNLNGNTNLSRAKPYDWVVVDADLHAHRAPVEIGGSSFTNGAVIDTRVYTPLEDIAPAQLGDSSASNMQHMGVVRDFLIPAE